MQSCCGFLRDTSNLRAGKRLAAVETAALKVLLAKLEVAHALVQTCSEPGELCLPH